MIRWDDTQDAQLASSTSRSLVESLPVEGSVCANDGDKPDPHPLSKHEGEYFENLGRFITLFADVETVLRMHCARATGMSEGVAGILLGDVSVQSASQLLTQLLREKGLPDDTELLRALRQLRLIAEMRNAILHRGVRMSDDGFVTSQGLPNSRLAPRLVDPEVLVAMHDDLAPIMAAMMLSQPADYPGWSEWAEGIRTAVRAPWRYTP